MQRFLDADGFFIVGCTKAHEVGDVIEYLIRAETGEVFPHKVVVIGGSSRQEAVQQLERHGLSYQQRFDYLHFYKVVAE